MSKPETGNRNLYVKSVALNCLKKMEISEKCSIILAGIIGSQMDGLATSESDYDIRAIASGSGEKVFGSFDVEGIRIEILIHYWEEVSSDIMKWQHKQIPIPSIVHEADYDLVHNDISRSQIRLASEHCILDKTTSNHDLVMHKGLLVKDGLDYEYARAYMNYKLYLQNDMVSVRKYLYTLYELFKINWIIRFRQFAPDFVELTRWICHEKCLYDEISKLLQINKLEVKEKNYICKSQMLNEYIKSELNKLAKELNCFSENNKEEFLINYV